MNSKQVREIAKTFWKDSLLELRYPIELSYLEKAILLTQTIFIVKLNRLNLVEICNYLRSKGISLNCTVDDNELYGFILTQNGYSFIFLNGTESCQEQTFTLAHELSHYLLDYKIPRLSLIKQFGTKIIDALDNKRDFTPEEKLQGIIKGYSLKPFTYLLDTPATSSLERLDIWNAENKADQLAMELLAPYGAICADISIAGIEKTYSSLKLFLESTLQDKYGFMSHVAEMYSKSLANKISGGISLWERWDIKK